MANYETENPDSSTITSKVMKRLSFFSRLVKNVEKDNDKHLQAIKIKSDTNLQLTTKVKTLLTKISNQDLEIKQKESKINQLSVNNKQHEAEIRLKNTELEHKISEISKLKAEVQQNNADLKQKNADIILKAGEIKQQNKENRQLRAECSTMKKQIVSKNSQISELKHNIEVLNTEAKTSKQRRSIDAEIKLKEFKENARFTDDFFDHVLQFFKDKCWFENWLKLSPNQIRDRLRFKSKYDVRSELAVVIEFCHERDTQTFTVRETFNEIINQIFTEKYMFKNQLNCCDTDKNYGSVHDVCSKDNNDDYNGPFRAVGQSRFRITYNFLAQGKSYKNIKKIYYENKYKKKCLEWG